MEKAQSLKMQVETISYQGTKMEGVAAGDVGKRSTEIVGELVGETLKFPTSPQAVEALLKNIGVDGIRYEEFFITSFDGDVLGLYDYLGEYENLDELNHLACLLSELPQSEIEKFEAALHMGAHTSSVADIINLAENLDCFEFYPEIESEEDLGRYFAEDLPIPAELKDYFDYEACGADTFQYIQYRDGRL